MPKKQIKSSIKDNFYVIAIKNLMNKGFSLEEATKIYKKEVEEGCQGGSEHKKPINDAFEVIKKELEQN